jgi:outer membrane receptor protein involved in Fe transport
LPLPNLPGTDNNFIAPQINPLNQNLGTIRIDYTATSATQVFGRFTRQKADQSSVVPAYGVMIFPGSAVSRGNQNSAVGNITHVFTPNLVLEGRFGWTLNQWSQDAPDQNATTSADFGIPGLNDACSACGGLAGFQIGGPVGGFAFGNNDHSHQVDNYGSYNFVEIATWNHGPHSFKFGSDTLLAWRDRRDTSSQGDFGCGAGICDSNGFSQNITGSAAVAGSGLSMATFLLGDVSSFGRVIYATALPEAHNTHQAFFAQDTWHVTPKLTLNLGVRWDYLGYPTSPQKGGIANFNFTNTNTIVSNFGDTSATADVEQNHNAWAPRVGFAYRVRDNTVVRAGFGRTYAIGFYGANFGAITNDWPNATRQNVKQDDIYQPILSLAGGPPAFVSGFDILEAAGNPGQYPTPNSTGFGTNFHNPENSIDQWNATVQHQFGNDLTVSASYVGNAVRHMFYRYDANAVLPGPGTSLDARRPYAPFGFLTNAYNQSNQTNSGYQGAQLQVQKRYSHGLMFTSAFTYGRSYDFGLHNAFDPFDTNESRGPQDNDRRFVLVFSHVWELPFGKGQAYLNKGGVTNAVLGGWHISGIETVESGRPYSVTWGDTSQLNSDCCTLVADITGDPSVSNKSASHWFNPTAFAQPGLYLQGDAGRNSFRGPGFVGVDLSLSKTFPITERVAFELQWEAYNAINRRNLSQPNGTADSSTAGQIFGITGTMRRMQVGGTLRF